MYMTERLTNYTHRLITDYSGPVGEARIKKIAESKRAQLNRSEPVARQYNYSGDPEWRGLPLQSKAVSEL